MSRLETTWTDDVVNNHTHLCSFSMNLVQPSKTPKLFRDMSNCVWKRWNFRGSSFMAHSVLPRLENDCRTSNRQGVDVSPRALASSLSVLVRRRPTIVLCGEQPSPTAASTVSVQTASQSSATEFVDMMADPAGPLGTLADTAPIVYPPNTGPSPWPPGPPPKAQPGVPVPTDPTVSPKMHVMVNPEPVTHSGVPIPIASCATNHPYTWYIRPGARQRHGAGDHVDPA